jgi:hypothetical protein
LTTLHDFYPTPDQSIRKKITFEKSSKCSNTTNLASMFTNSNTINNSRIQYKKNLIMKDLEKVNPKQSNTHHTHKNKIYDKTIEDNSFLKKMLNTEEDNFTKKVIQNFSKDLELNINKKTFLSPPTGVGPTPVGKTSISDIQKSNYLNISTKNNNILYSMNKMLK